MPFLAAKGYETYAISLRGTSGSPIFNPEDDQRRKQAKVCIGEHVQDITQYMDIIMDSGKLPPVLVSHSMAGLYLLKVLEKVSGEVEFGRGTPVHSLSGAMLFCSVPPAGIGPMTLRMVRSRPIAAIKTILGVAMKLATSWPWLARDIFFGESMGQENILRYMKYFTADSQTSLDLRDLTDNLPGRQVGESGTALWVGAPAAPPVQARDQPKSHLLLIPKKIRLESNAFILTGCGCGRGLFRGCASDC
jgi:pimeloyl-ACP methyl ester carboxylesterase